MDYIKLELEKKVCPHVQCIVMYGGCVVGEDCGGEQQLVGGGPILVSTVLH